MQDILVVKRDGPATTLLINRPEKLNALSAELVECLIEAVEAASEDDDTRLLTFAAEGDGFSGGFDFGGIETQTDGDLARRLIRIEVLLQAVYHAPMSTLALVHGACFGAAADLVCACHGRVGAPDVRFRMPGLAFGVVLGTRRLYQTVGAAAARDILGTSKVVAAEEARRVGLVTQIRGREEWPDVVTDASRAAQGLDGSAQRALLERTVVDTRDSDMAVLARSVAAPQLKHRIEDYLRKMKRSSQGKAKKL